MNKLITSAILSAVMLTAMNSFGQQSMLDGNTPLTRSEKASLTTKGATKSMTATLSPTNFYVAGTTMDINFQLNLNSPDLEYGDSLMLEFPANFIINSASDPIAYATEGQGDETLNTPIVSPVVTWGDNDNSYGGIELGVHNFTVNVTIPAGVTGPLTINWHIDGDEYGAAPHFIAGSSILNPLPAAPDLVVIGGSGSKYAEIPMSQPIDVPSAALVFNAGSTLTTPVNLVTTYAGTAYSNTQAVSNPLDPGMADTFLIPGTGFSTAGLHPVYFDASYAGDIDPTDNMDTAYINITDTTYSYLAKTSTATFSIGDGADGILGSTFNFVAADVVTEISYFSPNPDPTAMVSLVVYEMSNGLPSNLLWESDTFSTNATGPTTFSRPSILNVTAGQELFFGVREQLTGGMNLGSSTDDYTPSSHFVYYQGAWGEIGDLGFPQAFDMNIVLGTVMTDPNISVSLSLDNKYDLIPLSQSSAIPATVSVTNLGADLTAATDMVATYQGTGYTDTQALTIPMASNSNQIFNVTGTAFSTTGTHTVDVEVNVANDSDPSDNTHSQEITITDSTYSYFDTVTNGTFGIGDGSEGILGMTFDIVNLDTLTSVSYFSPTPDPTAMVSFVVYDMSNDLPNNLLWESDTFSINSGGSTVFQRELILELTAGMSYFIGVREQLTGSMSIGSNSFAFQPNSAYAYFQGAWNELGASGFPIALAVRANFGQVLPNSVTELAINEFNVFPNPSTGYVNLNGQTGNVTIMSIEGKVVKTATINSANTQIDISDLTNGVYIIQVSNEKGISSSKVTLRK